MLYTYYIKSKQEKGLFEMKKIISCVCAAVMGLSCLTFTGCGNNSVDDGKMRKNMTAVEYAADMGLGVNLGNTMDAYYADTNAACAGSSNMGDSITSYETCWGAIKTTQEIISGMKSEGFNTVRVPVYWGNGMVNDGKFNITDAMFDRVQEIIDYAREADMYVVINVHHYDEFLVKKYSEEQVLKITNKIWTQIAEHYRNYSDYLIFEGFNENLGTVREGDSYTDDEKFDYVNKMNQTFVDAVRATGGNNKTRLLIASGYWTNIDLTTDERFKMPTDSAENKLMVSVHYVDNAMYWTNRIGGQAWLDYSKEQCELLKKAFTDKGIPVFVGECTSIYEDERFAADATHTDSTECLSIMYDMMLDYGFVPILWDVNKNFYSRTEYRINSDSDRALIAELSKELAEKNAEETAA